MGRSIMNFDAVQQITAQKRSATFNLESYTLARSRPCCVRLAPLSVLVGSFLVWYCGGMKVGEYLTINSFQHKLQSACIVFLSS